MCVPCSAVEIRESNAVELDGKLVVPRQREIAGAGRPLGAVDQKAGVTG